MGGYWSSPQYYQSRILELSKTITSVDDYDKISTLMFENDIYNRGRVEVWFIMSCDVHNRLPVDQQDSLEECFTKWMSSFLHYLPEEKKRLRAMEASWKQSSQIR